MIEILELLARQSPPTDEEMAELESDALLGQAILLGHMSHEQESRLLALATMLALKNMSPEEEQHVLANPQAVADAARWVAYIIAGIVFSQEWR